MNGRQSASLSGSDSALVFYYEGLRRQALGARGGQDRGLGLALLVRQGMKSWMQAWSQYVIRKPAMSPIKTELEDVPSIQSSREVVVILASMVQGSQEARS